MPLLLKNPDFPINVPRRLAEKMRKNDLTDPLFLQFVPLHKELESAADFTLDPVQDGVYVRSPKLIRKYAKRALLVTTSVCAMHCRYCFRQNFPYEKEAGFEKELSWIESNPDIFEVILSGGDPLSLPDATLQRLLDRLDAIPHVKVVRFHTRFPIGIPERITDALLTILANRRVQIVMVLHINHPNELDDQLFVALSKLQKLGIPLMTQSVFLRGINDHVDILEKLFLMLIAHGIIPYQLHRLDKVRGTAHFLAEDAEIKGIMRELDKRLPGYALPEYTADVPGESSKVRLMWA